MADIVPSGVTGNGKKKIYSAGAVISEGDWVYVDTSDNNKVKPASNAGATTANVRGVALNDAADDSDVIVLLDGTYDPGVVLTEGVIFVLSTGGAMAPVEDHTGANGSGKFATTLGRGNSDGVLRINIDVATAALA
ncbi:hypothetical protein C8B47_03615 [filamentous cyanobacterium CCP4]|nr:hypothetical protein C8B47_03615 [filamentous cyanobacterium CCP4]